MIGTLRVVTDSGHGTINSSEFNVHSASLVTFITAAD